MELKLISDAQVEVAMRVREYARYPGTFEKVGYRISELCSILKAFSESPFIWFFTKISSYLPDIFWAAGGW